MCCVVIALDFGMGRVPPVLWLLVTLLASAEAGARDPGRAPPEETALPGVELSVSTLLAAAPEPRADQVLSRAKPLVRRLAPSTPAQPEGGCTLVLGLPGRSTSSERMMSFLAHGLAAAHVPLVIATLEDPVTGGPLRQGVANLERRNRWLVDGTVTQVLRRLVTAVARGEGCTRLYVLGYSSGASAAAWVAIQLAGRLGALRLEGVVSISSSSKAPAAPLRAAALRLLFITAPARRPGDRHLVQADARTRRLIVERARRLAAEGLVTYVREVESVRRHPNWHWGVISPCPFRPRTGRAGDPGIWPDYGHPGAETFAYLIPFLEGRVPPAHFEVGSPSCTPPPAAVMER